MSSKPVIYSKEISKRHPADSWKQPSTACLPHVFLSPSVSDEIRSEKVRSSIDHREALCGSEKAIDRSCDTARCIHWLFEEQVERSPLAVAVDDGRCAMNFSQLNARANRLAKLLCNEGVGRGQTVGLCMERSTDLIVALLGILKCGAAYVPMEPAWPDERIRFIADSVHLDACVIDTRQVHRLPNWAGEANAVHPILCVRDDAIDFHRTGRDPVLYVGVCGPDEVHPNPPHESSPDDRAYIIFTSGSSGQPKGVSVRHRPVVNLIDWVNKTFNVATSDRLLFSTAVAFDLSVYDVFGILAAGGSLRVASNAELQDAERLAAILQCEGITFWDSAPAALERLTPFLINGRRAALRLVFLSGDWIPLALPPLIQQIFPGVRLIALGGATEATIWSNYYEVKEIDPTWVSIPYGQPIQNAQYYVMDADMKPCPVGASGDLYIAGLCLADGYVNDPELTARKFIPNPFGGSGRLYQTGDRARFFPDGNIEFLGRADRQIKIRGFRVEPAEIEAVLERHPKVRRAVVLAEGELRTAKQLVAYVVLRNQSPAEAMADKDIRAFLREKLPEYMVPARVIIVQHLPLTGNGKVDHAALRALGRCNIVPIDRDPPTNDIQRKLVELWRRVLRLDDVGIHDNFFELGADSLQTVEMVLAAAGMGVDVRLRDLHANSTIAQLSAMCSTPKQNPVAYVSLNDIPLTPIQQWFFARPLKFPARYNAVFGFDIARELNLKRLSDAMRHLMNVHDALRLRFKCTAGRWVQFLAPEPIEPDVDAWDLSSLSDEEQVKQLQERVIGLRCGLDLERGPLAKLVLVNRGSEHCQQLLLILHHLIFDAVSLRVLMDDLTTACDQLDHVDAVHLSATCPYSRYAQRLNEYAASDRPLAEEAYWLRLPWEQVAALPRDFPAGRNHYGSSRTVCEVLSGEETSALAGGASERFGASVGEILLAACALVLSHWCKHPTVVVELTDHGRRDLLEDISLSRTVGYITSNTPLVLNIPCDSSLGNAVGIVHDDLLRLPYGGIGHGILRYLTPETTSIAHLRRQRPPELKFNYLGSMTNEGTDRFRPAAMTFPGALDGEDERAYLLNLEICIANGRLHIEWKFNEAIHRRSTIESLLGEYILSLQQLIQNACSTPPLTDAGIIGRSAR